MNISNFLSTISSVGGFARPNKFMVYIYTSNLMSVAYDDSWLSNFAQVDTSSNFSNRLSLMCSRAILPGMEFQMDRTRVYGPGFSFPVLPVYQDVTLTFYIGSDMAEYYFFQGWMYTAGDPITNDFNYISEFSCNIDIMQIDDFDDTSYITRLEDAYPISISPVMLSWEDNNQIHKVDVTFTYKSAVPFDGKESTAATPVRGQQIRFGAGQTVSFTPKTSNPNGSNSNSSQ